MARKTTLNRRQLRDEADAAQQAEAVEAKSAPPKKATKRKSRAKSTKGVRLKAFWGVFNQALKRVAVFEYAERKQADKKAEDLTASQKTPHFVQIVKEVIEE
jgi:hypothetical protein